MNIKPIKTEEDYQEALARLDLIFNAKAYTTEGEELEILSMLIDQYEKLNFKTT